MADMRKNSRKKGEKRETRGEKNPKKSKKRQYSQGSRANSNAENDAIKSSDSGNIIEGIDDLNKISNNNNINNNNIDFKNYKRTMKKPRKGDSLLESNILSAREKKRNKKKSSRSL